MWNVSKPRCTASIRVADCIDQNFLPLRGHIAGNIPENRVQFLVTILNILHDAARRPKNRQTRCDDSLSADAATSWSIARLPLHQADTRLDTASQAWCQLPSWQHTSSCCRMWVEGRIGRHRSINSTRTRDHCVPMHAAGPFGKTWTTKLASAVMITCRHSNNLNKTVPQLRRLVAWQRSGNRPLPQGVEGR